MADGRAASNVDNISSDYRKVFDATPDPMVICGRDGSILAFNAASPVKFCFTPDEFPLLKLRDLDSTMKSDARMRPVLSLEEGEELGTEVKFHRQDGLVIDLEVSYHPIKWAGEPALLVIFRDVTQRKLLENSISSYQAQVLAVMNSTDDFVWSVDAKEFRLLSFNDAFESFFKNMRGIAPKLGILPRELLQEDVAGKWIGFYEAALRDGRFSTEYKLSREGRVLLLNLHEITRGGKLIGISSFCKDITDEKRADEDRRRSESYRRALFESARDAILILRDGRFIDCNPAALLLYGRRRDQMLGKTPVDFSPVKQRDGSDSIVVALDKIRLAMEGSTAVFDWQHKKGDGTVIDCEVNLNKFELDGEILLQAIVRDITERRRTMQALIKSMELIRSVTDSMSDLLWCVDADTLELVFFNSSFAAYFKKKHGVDLAKGMHLEDMLKDEKFIRKWHGLYRRALSEGDFQTDYISVDGRRFIAFLNLLKADGKVFGITITGKDMTGID